jgi:hypothetical protein
MVMLEAEAAQEAIAGGGHAWTPATDRPDFAGDGYVVASPDSGDNISPEEVGSSAELRISVAFTEPGTYMVWIRGWATGGGDNSVHVSLDEQGATTAANITGVAADSWFWTNVRDDGAIAILEVPEAGIHTVHVWMREDGFALDRLILTTDGSYVPNGKGPRPSPRIESASIDAPAEQTPLVAWGDGTDRDAGSGPARFGELPSLDAILETGDGTEALPR